MNPRQVEYFRQKLLRLRAETLLELDAATVAPIGTEGVGDQADQASASEDREFSLINRERARHLLQDVELALQRIEKGTYGYCEDSGEPISLRRLEAQPTATLTIEAQQAREKRGR